MRRFIAFLWLALAVGFSQPAAAYPLGAKAPVLSASGCANKTIALDFLAGGGAGLFCLNGTRYSSFTAIPGASVSRASPETCVWADGHLTQAAANQLCVTDLGVGIWESRTNFQLQSQAFDNGGSWGAVGITVTPNQIAGPDTTTTGALFANTATTGVHRNNSVSPIATVSGSPYTLSVYAKSGAATHVGLEFKFTDASQGRAAFVLLGPGTATVLLGASATATITSLTNGWYRCTLTATVSSTSESVAVGVLDNANDFNYTGNGESAYFWGADFEAGPFASPYISTLSSAASRTADNVKITGLTVPSAYALVGRTVRYVNIPAGTPQNIVSAQDAGGTNYTAVYYRNFASNFGLFVVTAGVEQLSNQSAGTESGVGVVQTAGLSLGAGTAQFAANGQIISSQSVMLPVPPTQVNLGLFPGPVLWLNGYLQSAVLIPRTVSSGELQEFTR